MSEFDKIIGPLLIGIFLNTYLFGIVMFQYASYQNRKYSDPYWIKLPVGVLFLVDTFHCAAAIYMIWTYCVENYVNPTIFAAGFWAATFTPICTAVSGLVAHLFLGHRFFRLTGNKGAYAAFVGLAVAVFVLAMSAGIQGIVQPVSMVEIVAQTSPVHRNLVTAWLVVQAALDLLLAGSLGYALSHCTPSFMGAEPAYRRAFRGATQIGLFACIFSVADMISFLGGRNTNLYTTFALPMGPLYSNIILDTLLSRRWPSVSHSEPSTSQTNTTKNIWIPSAPTQSMGGANSFSLHSIHVQTEVFSDAGRRVARDPLSRTVSEEYKTDKGVAV
ncbi:hypothetical protein Hypma_004029 [Hypsizygus marmoreus]|uniref:DUF6534 domain-containing protein n=1 Tax=Hypsizygus marmoreus TaxID=39966 RepID=A0A369J0W9_HYPMA|nr:hypothetical protein Hypma_004029 [Hypsizygus marmoreus]